MLHELQRKDGVEALAGQGFDRGAAIVDVEAGGRCMGARNLDGLRLRVDGGDGGAQPRHRLRHEPAAASGVQQAEARQWARRQRVAAEAVGDPVPHPADPDRVHGVERPELALRVPPLIRHRGETPGFLDIHGCAGFCHRNLFQPGGRNMLRPPAGGKPLQAVEGCFMARLVLKFGGTSVADREHIRNAAGRVAREAAAGHEVAVVVSAMSGVTNDLVGQVAAVAPVHDTAEYDAVVATGEQITSGLMALTLQEMGVPARSFQGWQLPIRTDGTHGRARIRQVEGESLRAAAAAGQVAVVAGFQGLSPDGRVTTLGRGGSDTTAVALAAALEADRCDIYTDVDGVYTCDPRVVPRARKIERIAFEEMLEMASQGAKVLQTRSVAMAMRRGVRLRVLSSFEETPGTLIVGEDEIVEEQVVTGVAVSREDAKVTLTGVEDRPGVAAAIFGPLADAEINVDMIVQNVADGGRHTDITFTVPKPDLERATALLREASLAFESLVPDPNVAKVSVVGIGMRSHAGVAQRMFATLAARGINIEVISTSEIKISVLIEEEYAELAARALHTAYGLDRDD